MCFELREMKGTLLQWNRNPMKKIIKKNAKISDDHQQTCSLQQKTDVYRELSLALNHFESNKVLCINLFTSKKYYKNQKV